MFEIHERPFMVRPVKVDAPKMVYGWLVKPSVFTGVASAFDFLAFKPPWRARRFLVPDVKPLTGDFVNVAADFRRAYYNTLHEHGIPSQEPEEDSEPEQFSFFGQREFRIEK